MTEVQSNLVVKAVRGTFSDRAMVARAMPFHIVGATAPRPDHIDGVNILSGVCKRFAADSPPRPALTPDLTALHSCRGGIMPSKRRLLRMFKRFTNLAIRQMDRRGLLTPVDNIPSFEEWVEARDKPKAWKDSLREAWNDPVGPRGKIPDLANLVTVKGHVKDEPYTDFKHLRLINARVDYAKAFLGPTFKAIEKIVCKLPWFWKGKTQDVPVESRSSIILDLIDALPNFVISDYSAFESHFTTQVMQSLEYPLYRYMLKNATCPDLSPDFLNFWLNNVAGRNTINLCKQFVIYIYGVRMSGEMNTSLANGWCNLMLVMFAMWDRGATWDEIFDLHGFVEGDDGIFNIPQHLAPTTEQMAMYGFRLKMESTSDVCEASFCGMIFDPECGALIADPTVVLLKLGWAGRNYLNVRDDTMAELQMAKAMSYACQYNGCPIISPVAFHLVRQYIALGIKVTSRSLRLISDEYKARRLQEAIARFDRGLQEKTPLDTTRQIVSELFGLSINDQVMIEGICAKWCYGDPGVQVPLDTFAPQYLRAWDQYVESPIRPDPVLREIYWARLSGHCRDRKSVV